nr:hypothetical protein [Tanacetum cinerariifolium]
MKTYKTLAQNRGVNKVWHVAGVEENELCGGYCSLAGNLFSGRVIRAGHGLRTGSDRNRFSLKPRIEDQIKCVREERRDEKKRWDHLKQDQTMLAIKKFSERKKVFRERNKTGKNRAKRMVVKEIEDVFLEEIEFGWWFEQDIDGENEDDNENKLVMVNEEGWMS